MAELVKKACEPLVGADIEAFLIDKDFTFVPCVGILPGTKEHPHPIKGLKSGFAMQEDNVMVEFNIPPASTYTQFYNHIYRAQAGVKEYLTNKYPGKGYAFIHQSDALFNADQLTSEQAKTIGCEPDFDAYQGGAMRRDLPALSNWRGAGGHVHLGGDFQCPDFVAALFADLCIGVRCKLGNESGRRSLWYGKPGIYRPKPYGIEYRTPSSVWASHKSSIQNVGNCALRLAKWLTHKDAREIQVVFRAIDWGVVYNAMRFKEGEGVAQREARIKEAIHMGQKAGAPV